MTDLIEMVHQKLVVAKTVVLDTETSGLDWRHDKTVGYVWSFSGDPRDSHYLPIRHEGGGNLAPSAVLRMQRSALKQNPCLRVVGHNLGFDLKFSSKDDIEFPEASLEDTQINAFLLNEFQPGGFSLGATCRHLGVQDKKGEKLYAHLAAKFGGEASREQMGNYHKLAGDDVVGLDYAVGDGTSTWQAWEKQQEELDRQELRNIWDIECRLIPILNRAMLRGIKVDEARLAYITKIVAKRLDVVRGKLPKNFNERGPNDLKKLFTDAGITDWPTTAKGNASFIESWLQRTDPGRLVVAVRKLSHLQNSFIQPLVDRHLFKGRVHTNYNQTLGEEFGTVTGRLSSNAPNMQQVPKRDEILGPLFRSIFVPDDGFIWGSADYSQIEPRLLAHYGQVKVLLDGYTADPPIDAHQAVTVAANIRTADGKWDRETGKRLNQAIITGAGEDKVVQMLHEMPAAEARMVRNRYLDSMPEIRRIQKRASDVMLARGYVNSLLGRRARLDDRRFAYKALNRLLQCGNADVIKRAMVLIGEYFKSEGDVTHLMGNTHDDLDFHFREEHRNQYERALEMMQDYGPGKSVELSVSLPVDPGEGATWAESTWGQDKVEQAFAAMGATYK